MPRHPQLRVLVLAASIGRPSFEAFMDGLREVLVAEDAASASVQLEDFSRPAVTGGEDWLVGWMARKYSGQRFDVLLAMPGAPLDLVQILQEHIWPRARILTVSPDPQGGGDGNPYPGIAFQIDARRAIELARALFPETRRIVYVGGPGYGNATEVTTPEALAEASSLQVLALPSLGIEELQARLSRLAPDTVVFLGAILRDRDGRRFAPRDALELLEEQASRPILAFSDSYVGYGAVGGIVVDSREVGRQAGRVVEEVIAAAPDARPVLRPPAATKVLLDHRQLLRWKVPEQRIPAGAQVLFRPPSIWETHRAAVVATLVTLLGGGVTITMLLLERRRRTAAEQQLRLLSASVIQAQEKERGHVSRELHDDVNQRLALATIELDRLARSPGLPEAERSQARAVQDRLRVLGRDVHEIAYRLRPTEIEFVGLVPALRALAGNVASAGRMSVEVVDSGWPSDAGPEAGIVLYRVAQEALQNVMKHSGAAGAKVIVSGSARHLTLTVTDDGRGFDPAGPAGGGRLGLAGMRERIRQVGGSLTIESLPDTGTRIEAVVPRPVTLRTSEEISHA